MVFPQTFQLIHPSKGNVINLYIVTLSWILTSKHDHVLRTAVHSTNFTTSTAALLASNRAKDMVSKMVPNALQLHVSLHVTFLGHQLPTARDKFAKFHIICAPI